MTHHGNRFRLAGMVAIGLVVALLLADGSLFAQAPAMEASPAAGNEAELAAATFERLKSLAGEWRTGSTRGWTGTMRYELAALGSVVVARSEFEDSPEETMYTMYHMDGDRLMLTHYCEARNQPRLAATGFADGGDRVTFTFLDGTNLPSRDAGHMDQAVFRFLDGDRFTSKWTWYQEGKEKWMEEIQYERMTAREPAAAR